MDISTRSQKSIVAVIFGGRSGEHEVSLMSGLSVLAAIDREKYSVIEIGITPEGAWFSGDGLRDAMASAANQGKVLNAAELSWSFTPVTLLPDPSHPGLYAFRGEKYDRLDFFTNIDVVIPILHGTFGEDGTLQGLLELSDLAYTGAGVLGSALGMDKGVFKDVMIANNIPVVDSIVVNRSEIEQDIQSVISQAENLANYPLFVKPANLGSSVGITKCRNRSDLFEGLKEAIRFDRRVLIEQGIENPREIEVSVLGNDQPFASIPGEIIPSQEFYSYEAKYVDGTSELIIPADLSNQMLQHLQALAIIVFKAVDCSGMARVDFLVTRAGLEIYVSEINTIPGFTTISMYPKLWEASGVPYTNLIDRLIRLALERKNDRNRTQRRFTRES